MFEETLRNLNLPKLLSRKEMLNILFEEEYGYLPQKPTNLSWNVKENIAKSFCAGKAKLNKITITCEIGKKSFSFPFYLALPTAEGRHPFFVHINFRDSVPDHYMPTEELIDNGFAVFSFCYKDVTSDNDDFTDGLAGVLYENGKRKPNDAGKIAMWAWAAQRVMDYAQTLDDVLDLKNAIICGHSRLGKAALLTAATDERFAFAYSNDSGCGGAAITRGKIGETVKDICKTFPYWFCENYKKYVDNEDNMPFDQHYLVACIAPRKVLIGSASEDLWADPVSEQRCCIAASSAFENGFVCEKFPAEIGDEFFKGDIGYHLRKGLHYYSREDWLKLIRFVNMHRTKVHFKSSQYAQYVFNSNTYVVNQYEEIVLDLKRQFENNCSEQYTLDSLARRYHISKSALSHCFRALTGVSVMKYLRSCRFAHAEKLLADTSKSIGEIVEECGFSDVNNFSRSFKRKSGISPRDFRKKMQSKSI